MDKEEAAAKEPEGLRMPCVCTYAARETVSTRPAVNVVSFHRLLGPRENELVRRSSGRIVMSRGAQFMEDTFESGKRRVAEDKTVEFSEDDDVSDCEDHIAQNTDTDEDMGDGSLESQPANE
ncbi:hypothetical protein ABG067_007755, partial [Albugo candida]